MKPLNSPQYSLAVPKPLDFCNACNLNGQSIQNLF